MAQAVIDGKIPFFISTNRVILSPGDEGIIPPKYFRSVFNPSTSKYLYQKPFDHICVFDLKTNCSKQLNEIIGLSMVVFDSKHNKVHQFHTFVRPSLEKQITQEATNLTGITNEMCFGKTPEQKKEIPILLNAIKRLHRSLSETEIFKTEFVLLTCGDVLA